MTNIELDNLSKKIAYITINPRGNFLKSAQVGFSEVGLHPMHLIYVKPITRLKKEAKKYKLSFVKEFILPQISRNLGNKKSYSKDTVIIKIPNVYRISKLNSIKTVRLLKELGIKYLINCGAGIFKKEIIDLPGILILNAHAGKLPEYKNMNVVEWAICNGDKVIGTIHQIDSGVDTGPVWIEEEIRIRDKHTLLEAREFAFDYVIRMMGRAVIMNEVGEIMPKYHDNSDGRKWYKMHSFFQKEVNKILIKHL